MSNPTHHIAERAAEISTYVAATVSVSLWGLTISDFAALLAAVVALLSFCVHFWAAIRRDRREQARFLRDMESPVQIEDQDNADTPTDRAAD